MTITIAIARRRLTNAQTEIGNAYRTRNGNPDAVRQAGERRDATVDQLIALEDAGATLPPDLKRWADHRRRYIAAFNNAIDAGHEPDEANDIALHAAEPF